METSLCQSIIFVCLYRSFIISYAVLTDMNVIYLQIGAGPVIRVVRLVSPSYETA